MLPALAWADSSVPARSDAAPWRTTCAARLERARKAAATVDTRFARGKAEAFVDEDVLPLREHARYQLELPQGKEVFRIEVGMTDQKPNHEGWYEIREEPFPMGWRLRRARMLNHRFADVGQKLTGISDDTVLRLQGLWEAAADDCLRMR
jgi:hypothetical protein